MGDLGEFLVERNRMLENFAVDTACKIQPTLSREVIVIALHKARVECLAISESSRRESMEWLKKHGCKRAGNLEFDADGSLPT